MGPGARIEGELHLMLRLYVVRSHMLDQSNGAEQLVNVDRLVIKPFPGADSAEEDAKMRLVNWLASLGLAVVFGSDGHKGVMRGILWWPVCIL